MTADAERHEASAGRLDAVLARVLSVPRVEAQRLIGQGAVRVDGRARPKSFRLEGGEVLEVVRSDGIELPVEGPPVEVRYQDRTCWSSRSQRGWSRTRRRPSRSGTLVNRLLGMQVPLSSAGGDRLRPGHRSPTRRRHERTADRGQGRCHPRGIRRDAQAPRDPPDLPRTRPWPGGARPVRGRRPARTSRVAGDDPRRCHRSREPSTGFEVLERFARATFLEATPRTGRTHQIRVHLSVDRPPDPGRRPLRRRRGRREGDRTRPGPSSTRGGWRSITPSRASGSRWRSRLPEDLTSALERLRRDDRPEPDATDGQRRAARVPQVERVLGADLLAGGEHRILDVGRERAATPSSA